MNWKALEEALWFVVFLGLPILIFAIAIVPDRWADITLVWSVVFGILGGAVYSGYCEQEENAPYNA